MLELEFRDIALLREGLPSEMLSAFLFRLEDSNLPIRVFTLYFLFVLRVLLTSRITSAMLMIRFL